MNVCLLTLPANGRGFPVGDFLSEDFPASDLVSCNSIFIDGPTQFIEVLRLVRTNQIRIPQDVDEAIDTVINFASVVREAQITMNLATPFLHFFPNVFRGAELLSTEVLFNVFAWLAPLSPTDVSSASLEGLWNRWDVKSSTTARYNAEKRYQTLPPEKDGI